MSGSRYVARHRREETTSEPEPGDSARWPGVLGVITALLLVAGAVALVLRWGGSSEAGSSPVPPVAAEAAPIAVCTQASVEDRAGLLLVVGLPGVTDADDPLVDRLASVGVGGVMLRAENITGERQVTDLVAGLRERLGPHLLVAVDEEGGRVSPLRSLGESFPSARRLGERGADAAGTAGRAVGDVLSSIDADWVLAPVADLDAGPAGGVIGDRSFGGDPIEVAAAADAYVDGLHDAGIAVTMKHFPGHGGAGDPHAGDAVDPVTLDELTGVAMEPFRSLVAHGAEAAMVGHVSYPEVWGDLPASLEPRAYALLRSLGFDGVAVTDALGMGAVHARFGFDVAPAMAVAAGADAVLVNQGEQVEVLRDGLVAAVGEGRLDERRLNEAVGRVLTLRGQAAAGVSCPG